MNHARLLLLLCLVIAPPTSAAETSFVLDECLVLKPVGRHGRFAVHSDAVEHQLVTGRWKAPKSGDTVAMPGGPRTWEEAKAKDGGLQHDALKGGYLFWKVQSDAARVMILEASGHALVSVNGEPRQGDVYSHGYVNLPILLRKGDNELLFHVWRGGLRARLVLPRGSIFLDPRDTTLPDVLAGVKDRKMWGAMLVVNATEQVQERLSLRASSNGGEVVTVVPPLLPLSVRKVGFSLPHFTGEGPKLPVRLSLTQDEKDRTRVLSAEKFDLALLKPEQLHRRTFVSDIDGSVQYYAVLPAQARTPREPPALVLTLHGAAVEATGQAGSYSPKSWATLVAPTNRRPFGFDWEDWGRLDAMEVLALAQKDLGTDPRRTYLTGHSMGGHGVWHLGLTYPDRFAAIGPSAGWISFWTYSGRKPDNPTPMQELLFRSSSASDTQALLRNASGQGVFILHGDKDGNVPVGQARTMKAQLEKFHRDLCYHEQEGAGHWWSADGDGVECVDWAPMFDLFARRMRPSLDAVRQVQFTTASPGVSATMHWVTIEQQSKCMKPSSVDLRVDPGRRRFRGTTDNVSRLSLDLTPLTPAQPLALELDGQKLDKIDWPKGPATLHLMKKDDKWEVAPALSREQKGPHRYGPFKDAFRQRMLFVYGTKGTKEENAWSLARARLDAESFWYRGNGSVDVIADRDFDASRQRDRNVILYGNADTHGAWKALLAESPLQVSRGKVTVGERAEKGDDLACVFVRPRPGSETSLVGVVSGSGLAGMKLTERLGYFVSGSGFPDVVVIGPEMLTREYEGVRGAGYFGMDWSVKNGEFLWSK